MSDADSDYMAPGVADWAPRLRLTRRAGSGTRQDGTPIDPGVLVEFEATDNATRHAWAEPDDQPALHFSAVVKDSVNLVEGVEYFAYFVPVEATIPT